MGAGDDSRQLACSMRALDFDYIKSCLREAANKDSPCLYVTFRTDHAKAVVPERFRPPIATEMTIVIQNHFRITTNKGLPYFHRRGPGTIEMSNKI